MEDQTFDESYEKGYNRGFLLNEFHPELLHLITKDQDKENPYFMGMNEGRQAQAKEAYLEKLRQQNQMSKLQTKRRMR